MAVFQSSSVLLPPCSLTSEAQNNCIQHATCAPNIGDCCIFHVANEQAKYQDQRLVNNGDCFVTNEAAAASFVSQSHGGFGKRLADVLLCVRMKVNYKTQKCKLHLTSPTV